MVALISKQLALRKQKEKKEKKKDNQAILGWFTSQGFAHREPYRLDHPSQSVPKP
jgi:hypothetical protein